MDQANVYMNKDETTAWIKFYCKKNIAIPHIDRGFVEI